jgi:hypothetical protein
MCESQGDQRRAVVWKYILIVLVIGIETRHGWNFGISEIYKCHWSGALGIFGTRLSSGMKGIVLQHKLRAFNRYYALQTSEGHTFTKLYFFLQNVLFGNILVVRWLNYVRSGGSFVVALFSLMFRGFAIGIPNTVGHCNYEGPQQKCCLRIHPNGW